MRKHMGAGINYIVGMGIHQGATLNWAHFSAGSVTQGSYFSFFSCLLGLHPRHMEIPRLGGKLEPQLLAYATATATPDPSHICYLQHNSWQHRILNPMSEASDGTCNLMVPSWIRVRCATTGTLLFFLLNFRFLFCKMGTTVLCIVVTIKCFRGFWPEFHQAINKQQ